MALAPLIFDNHLHSKHSFDGFDSIEDICLCALQKGVSGIAVTNHCEMGIYYTPDWKAFLSEAKNDILKARERFGDKLLISFGVELGQPMHNDPETRELLSSFDFDVVLGSVHNIRDHKDFYFLLADNEVFDKKNVIDRYFEEQLEMTKRNEFDILAHLTYAYRYFGHGNGMPEPQQYEDLLRELFTTLAQNGKALEVNTSGAYRTPASELLPQLWELKLFKECGGELVTIGSDSHKAATVAGGNAEGRALLLEAGFKYQAFYQNRKPKLFKL